MSSNLLLVAMLALGGLLIYLAIGEQLERFARPRLRRIQAAMAPYFTRRTLMPLGGAVIFALIYPGVLLKLYFLIVGGLITYYLVRKRRKATEMIPPRQIVQLVLGFRSVYQLQPSVFSSLTQLTRKLEEPLRSLIDIMTQTYFLTSSPQRAFEEFRKRTSASSDAVIAALDNFVDRMRTHDELRRQTETSLSSVTGQTSFMQALSLLIILVVGVIPRLRAAYQSLGMQIVFMVVMSVALGTSWYIEKQVSNLKEQIR